jgi:hypothetical protein
MTYDSSLRSKTEKSCLGFGPGPLERWFCEQGRLLPNHTRIHAQLHPSYGRQHFQHPTIMACMVAGNDELSYLYGVCPPWSRCVKDSRSVLLITTIELMRSLPDSLPMKHPFSSYGTPDQHTVSRTTPKSQPILQLYL